MKPCAVCEHKDCVLIEADVRSAEGKTLRVARKYSLNREVLKRHLRKCKPAPSRRSELLEAHKRLIKATKIAHKQYVQRQNANDAFAYGNLLGQLQSLTEMLDEANDPEARIASLVASLLNPLIKQLLSDVSFAIRGMRDDLRRQCGPEVYTQIDGAANQAMYYVGAQFQSRFKSVLQVLQHDLDLDPEEASLAAVEVPDDITKH